MNETNVSNITIVTNVLKEKKVIIIKGIAKLLKVYKIMVILKISRKNIL